MKEQLKFLRDSANLTQAEVAKSLGFRASTVSMWETGKRNPSISKLPEIARLFNCTIDELFKETA